MSVADQAEPEREGGRESRKARWEGEGGGMERERELRSTFFSSIFFAKFFGAMGVLEPQGLRRSCCRRPVLLNQVFSI